MFRLLDLLSGHRNRQEISNLTNHFENFISINIGGECLSYLVCFPSSWCDYAWESQSTPFTISVIDKRETFEVTHKVFSTVALKCRPKVILLTINYVFFLQNKSNELTEQNSKEIVNDIHDNRETFDEVKLKKSLKFYRSETFITFVTRRQKNNKFTNFQSLLMNVFWVLFMILFFRRGKNWNFRATSNLFLWLKKIFWQKMKFFNNSCQCFLKIPRNFPRIFFENKVSRLEASSKKKKEKRETATNQT